MRQERLKTILHCHLLFILLQVHWVASGLTQCCRWWEAQLALHYEMNPDAPRTTSAELISGDALQLALRHEPSGLGVHQADFDPVDTQQFRYKYTINY